MEISLMAVFPGFIIFIVGLLILCWLETKYLKDCEQSEKKPVKVMYQILYSSFSLLFFSLILDSIYHFAIDDSIGKEFAEGLGQIMERNGKNFDEKDFAEFKRMPYLLQNGFATGFFCVLSNLIALPIGKSLFKTLYKKSIAE
ncbi:MAG: hypothetical protein ACKO1F_12290 [Flammeovirgaceae bacterium]